VLAGRRRAIEALTPAADNIHILAGAAEPADALRGADGWERLATELLEVTRRCEVTLIDAGAGMTPWVDRLWQLATQVLLATTPSAPAAIDAYAALKLSHHQRIATKLQLVVTQCDDAADAARIHAGLAATCERFLGCELKPPAVLPLQAAADDAAFGRSLRLLAADIACEGRAITSRLPRRSSSRSVTFGATRGLDAALGVTRTPGHWPEANFPPEP
jgi:MinD-like ATPase involved in chromosome partitioning or flagellar assembly